MAITDIKAYLTPLTNNERAVLLFAAGVHHWVERTPSVEQDLERYARSRTKVPEHQREKAMLGLVAKGYATMEPKRGNYFYRPGYWTHNRGHVGREGAPYSKLVAEKKAGRWGGISWDRLCVIVPVEDVKGAFDAYREKADHESLIDTIARATSVEDTEAKKVAHLVGACRAFLNRYEDGGSPINEEDNGWYTVDRLVREVGYAVEAVDKWQWERHSIEREASVAREQVAA
jgi:hypothetical protein